MQAPDPRSAALAVCVLSVVSLSKPGGDVFNLLNILREDSQNENDTIHVTYADYICWVSCTYACTLPAHTGGGNYKDWYRY